MSFRPFEVQQTKPDPTGFACLLRKPSSKDGKIGLEFLVKEAVCATLEWTQNTKFAVLLGHDEHHGLVRLKADPTGTAKAYMTGGGHGEHKVRYMVIRLGNVPMFVHRPEGRQDVQFEKLEDGWVEIALPAWADDTKPKNAQAASATDNARRIHAVASTLR